MTDAPIPDPASLTAGRVPVLSVEQIRAWHATSSIVEELQRITSSREVSFDLVFDSLYSVVTRAERYGRVPTLGTVEWSQLPEGDPRRVGAIYNAALIWALQHENRQRGYDEASAHLAASGRASLAHRRRRDITDFYEQHPDLWRKAS